MPALTNWVLSHTSLSSSGTATKTYEIEATYGDVVSADVRIEALNGTPTTGSLAIAFEVAPVEYNGYNMNWEPSGDPIVFQAVSASDAYLGKLLVDGDWPATLNQALTYPLIVNRRIIVPPIGRIIRLSLTPTFTGGTSPAFVVSAAMAVSGK